MSSQLEKLRKRSCRKVEIDGDEFYLRSMTSDEVRIQESISDANRKAEWILGTVLVEADGSRMFPVLESETPEAFAARMADTLKDVEEPKKIRLILELQKASSVPSAETLAKN